MIGGIKKMSAREKSPIPVWLVLCIAIIAISFSSIFVKWTTAPVAIIAMYRLLMTNVVMLPFMGKHLKEIRGLSIKEVLLLIGSGAALGLHFLLWMGSLRYTTVASSTALMTLEPIFVMMGSWWVFHQRTNRIQMAGMSVAVIGAAAIGWGDMSLSGMALQGDILSILGTVAVAIHMILGQTLRAHSGISASVYSFIVFFVAALVLGVYSAVIGYSFVQYPLQDWGVFLLLALVSTLLGHALFNWLLKYMQATTVSMGVLGEPIGASILAYFLLGEEVSWLQAGAAVLLIGGVWIFLRGESREKAHSN
jgi:drug/metabolite transporter (DMT)-like permease